jgi:hypothetical protein
MLSFILVERPLAILLLIPLLISIHITSIKWVKIVGILSVILFSVGNIFFVGANYFELWLISVYLIFYFVLKAKSIFTNTKDTYNKNYSRVSSDEDFEKYIYNRDFSTIFTIDEFKELMTNCQIRHIKKKKKLFTAEGGPFDKVYYFAVIPSKAFVTLKTKDTTICYIKECAWIGVVEFITQFFNDSQRRWLIELMVDNITDVDIVWLEWDKNVILIFKSSISINSSKIINTMKY